MESLRPQKFRISISLFLWLVIVSPWCLGQEKHPLVPDAVIVQHAGSIGYLSLGAGYDIFSNQRGSIDILYGYVPRTKGGKLDIVTAKFAYRPFVMRVRDIAVIHPINPGAFFSYTLDRNLSFSWDREQYGKGYYGWSEAFRSHLSLSSEVEVKGEKLFGDEKIKAVVLYAEFNAADLYLVSWVLNLKELSVTEVFKFGVGVRLKF